MRSNSRITIENFSDVFFKCMDDCLYAVSHATDPYAEDTYEFIKKLQSSNQKGSNLFKNVRNNHTKILNIVNILDISKEIPDKTKEKLKSTVRELNTFIIRDSPKEYDQDQLVKSYSQYCQDRHRESKKR